MATINPTLPTRPAKGDTLVMGTATAADGTVINLEGRSETGTLYGGLFKIQLTGPLAVGAKIRPWFTSSGNQIFGETHYAGLRFGVTPVEGEDENTYYLPETSDLGLLGAVADASDGVDSLVLDQWQRVLVDTFATINEQESPPPLPEPGSGDGSGNVSVKTVLGLNTGAGELATVNNYIHELVAVFRNDGPDVATGFAGKVVLPAAMSHFAAVSSNYVVVGQELQVSAATLKVGQEIVVRARVKVVTNVGGHQIQALVTAYTGTDNTTTDNTSTVNIGIQG
jgi:hypothetical protein